MSVKESPLAKVKRLHSSKEALVDSLVASLAKTADENEGESKDELKARLLKVSNKKLLRLADSLSTADKHGGKDGLVAKITQSKGMAKDQDYANKLHSLSLHRLLDMAS